MTSSFNNITMPQHRFILQPYNGPSSRFYCPECEDKHRTFCRYIDTDTGDHLAYHVGRCSREEKCGYHYTPRQYFAENAADNLFSKPVRTQPRPSIKKPPGTLPIKMVLESASDKNYHRNFFVLYLARHFGWERSVEAAQKYHIGTAKHWNGACVFWQVDVKEQVRTGKIMLYDQLTGKRVKEPFNHIAWAHSLVGSGRLPVSSGQLADSKGELAVGSGQLADSEGELAVDSGQLANSIQGEAANCKPETANFLLQQCLFGEMLLNDKPDATVFITESEKTAVIASLKFPEHVWLAAGARTGLAVDKCQVLAGRKVILVPDVGCFAEWKEKARELNLRIPTATFLVHDELERDATEEERLQGIDWADRWLADHTNKPIINL